MIGIHRRRDALMIEMRAPPAVAHVEGVDAHRRAARQRPEPGALDAVRVAFAEQKPTEIVVADDAHRLDGKVRIEPLEVDRHVVARAAALRGRS